MSGEVDKPNGWVVLGQGPLADVVRAQMAADPDRYLPETWSIDPFGRCPCCGELVYRCKTRHTGWRDGFATHGNVVHTSYSSQTKQPDPDGNMFSCCCVAPNWGPKHDKQSRKPRKKSRRARR